MAVLPISEYDEMYFDGANGTYAHNAGYKRYSDFQYNCEGMFDQDGVPIEESTGNYFGDMIKALNFRASGVLVGKSCLVLGCAYGFEVQAMRDIGIDAYGIDGSPYAISQADPAVAPYVSVQDARTYVPSLSKNAYAYIYSRGFLECLTDGEVSALIPAMVNVAQRGQMHQFMRVNPNYYNIKTLTEWSTQFTWESTILVDRQDFANWIQI